MRCFIAKTCSCLLAFALAPIAYAAAEGESAGWIGATGGISVPNYNASGLAASSRTAFGLTGGAKIGTEYGVGAYYRTSSKDESVNGVDLKFGYDLYGVMAGYFFEGEAKGVYLGVVLGMSKVTIGTSASTTVSTSPLHYGLMAGYDHFLGEHFSLGGELNFITLASSSASSGGVTVQQDSFNTLNFNAALKFWF